MEVLHGLDKLEIINESVIATFGAFDGVHLAHQKLVEKIVHDARRIGGKSVLITFEPLPRSIIREPDQAMVLTSLSHKIRILQDSGLDYIVVIKFDEKFAEITAESFIKNIILRYFPNLKKFIIGPRAHFGHGAEGDVLFLKNLAGKYGFDVEVTDEMVIDDAVVSSSVIRKFVQSGELDAAGACLGRKYSIYGTVIRGKRIGRKLGFPTANIDPENEVYPPSGVYAVEVRLDKETMPGVLNIGFRPTLNRRDDLEPAIEVHIIGYNGILYDRKVEVVFFKRLRGEKCFVTKEELVKQIRRDVEETAKIYAGK